MGLLGHQNDHCNKVLALHRRPRVLIGDQCLCSSYYLLSKPELSRRIPDELSGTTKGGPDPWVITIV
jgi:hypothetical protein